MARRKKETINKNMTKKNKSDKKHKPKNKIKKFFAILLFWIIIIGILASVGFGGYYIYTADRFKVKSVKVENAEYYTEEQVIKTAKVSINKNMLFIGRHKIKNRILNDLPYIENVKIKIGKNSTLRIILQERQAKYVINNKDTNEYIRVDKYGIMLEKVKAEDIMQDELPLFGLSLDKKEEVGTKIPETEYKKIERFETIYEAYINSKIDSKVTSVKFENSKIILTLDYKMEVVTEPAENLQYKMKFLKEILKEVSGRSGRIDLTLDNPTFVEKIG